MNVGSIVSGQSSAQEAMETVAQTKAEAAKGDQQAVRKLAAAQAANTTQNAQPASNSVNALLDTTA